MKTRNGTPFRIHATDGIPPHLLLGAVQRPEGWASFEWTAAGFVNADESPSDFDINHIIGTSAGMAIKADVRRQMGVN